MAEDATAPNPAVGRIRGSAVYHFVRWVQDNVGVDVLDRAAERIPRHLRDGIHPGEMVLGILSSKWYRADAIHALLDALLADPDAPTLAQLAREPIEEVMNKTLRGVYRALFSWLATPDRYAKYAAKLWSSYYGDGEFVVVADDDDRGSVTTISQWSGHHPLLCEANLEAARTIYTYMGCVGVEVERNTCVDEGAPTCRYTVRWRS